VGVRDRLLIADNRARLEYIRRTGDGLRDGIRGWRSEEGRYIWIAFIECKKERLNTLQVDSV
jgi:hypothetical protein